MGSAKIAVSLPAATLRRLEVVRRRLGRSRSALVTEAIQAWLDRTEPSDEDRRYAEGYLKHPERSEETSATAIAAVESWEPWDETR
jgi:metal-responsive CopG/Arc/MetJ family transcriptional regulator